MDIDLIQQQRVTVLNTLYELSGSDTSRYVNAGELAAASHITDESQFKKVIAYLKGEGLVEAKLVSMGIPAFVRISHFGIREIEDAVSNPTKATKYFLPMNVLFVNNMHGSNIQQGNLQSSLTSSTVSTTSVEELRTFVVMAVELLSAAGSNGEWVREMRADLATLRAQAESPRPKKTVIHECLVALRDLAQSAAAGALGAQLATYIPGLIAAWS